MDRIDEKVLAALQRNAKQTTGRIAKKINVPVTTVHNRIKRMERDGIITSYEPKLNYSKLGRGIGSYIFVQAGRTTDQEHLVKRLRKLPWVESGKIITGGFDILLEVRVATMEDLNTLIVKELRSNTGRHQDTDDDDS